MLYTAIVDMTRINTNIFRMGVKCKTELAFLSVIVTNKTKSQAKVKKGALPRCAKNVTGLGELKIFTWLVMCCSNMLA